MKKTNLFSYATSELSQDAFICWLMAHAKNGVQNKNSAITQCALDILHSIPQLSNMQNVSDIQRQYSIKNSSGRVRIDVLLTVDDYKIIVEDKISAEATDLQIQAQKNSLIAAGIPSDKIICVFYKTLNQWYKPKVDKIFSRSDLLTIFSKYKNKVDSDIFTDYVEYLENFDYEENLYKTLPISQWWSIPYTGFFKNLINEKIVSKENWWGYVPNRSGGFMCLCWYPMTNNELNKIGLIKNHCNECKLQIENNKIAVKISADIKTYDKNKVTYARQKILEYFQNCIPTFQKPARQVFAKWMTVGYIEYDEKNFAEKIKLMNDKFVAMKTNFKLAPMP